MCSPNSVKKLKIILYIKSSMSRQSLQENRELTAFIKRRYRLEKRRKKIKRRL